jgi:hypothetical protein
MKSHRLLLAATLVAAFGSLGPARTADLASPEQLFREGRFAEAAEGYAATAARDPGDYEAALGLGRVALLFDRLDEAALWFEKAIALRPGEDDPKVMLGATHYRADDFGAAVKALEGVDVTASTLVIDQYPTLNVEQLKSFVGQTPYLIEGEGETTRLPLLKTEPLPLVSVRVNGEEVVFFIDTGGSEVTLDSDFARELGLPDFGGVKGTFSGGETTEVKASRIETLSLGDWTVRNLPVATLPLRQLSAGLGVKRIDGVLGTNLLYHFLATLDLPHGELILRRKDAASRDRFLVTADDAIAVPIWIASDHFMVGWGQVDSLPPTLLFVDSGLAGAGVKLAEPVIKAAGIVPEEDKATTGAGAGGDLKTVPYTVRRLAFGDAVQENVPGLYDGPFPWQTMFGFNLAGMIGHDFLSRYAVTFDFEGMRIFLH